MGGSSGNSRLGAEKEGQRVGGSFSISFCDSPGGRLGRV